jgi:sigma-E factor negative regulatory protein RseA
MSKETREHISCLMDGEISRETSRFLVRRLGSDDELSATWARYHLVRDCLRHQDGGMAGDDLCGRVSRAIASESPNKSNRGISLAWLKPAAGIAIAASVAMMAVGLVDPGSLQTPGNQAENQQVEQFTSPQSLTPVPNTRQASLLGQSQGNQKMNSYLLRHYQAAGTTGGKGFVSFVPIVITAKAADAEKVNQSDTEQASDKGEDPKQQ